MIAIASIAATAADAASGAAETVYVAAGPVEGGLLQDSSLWVLLAFIAAIALLARAGVHKTMGAGLDKRAQGIADEINEARKMREEAQELLAAYQRRQREAEEEAAAIIEQAKKDAKRMAAEAHEKIQAQMERRAKAAEDKIARAEAQALAEVRGQAADLAAAAAGEIIRERMDSGAQTAFIDKAIAGLREKAN